MRKNLSQSNLLVAGLARNCEKKLEDEVRQINLAFSDAKSINWLVIESDSDDRTLDVLNKLSNKDFFDFISLGKLEKKIPNRTERIAKCRNLYLEELKFNSKYNEIDYVIVADLDGVNSKLSLKSVKSCWETDVDWDACFANQSAPYYDIWALRHDLWNPADCFEQNAFFSKYSVDVFFNRYSSILSKMITIPEDVEPIKVKSAFGGLGIYKKNLLLKGEYSGLKDNGENECEHLNFHINHLSEANLYIIPSLINSGWNEHSRQRSKLFLFILFCATRFFSIKTIKKLTELFKKL